MDIIENVEGGFMIEGLNRYLLNFLFCCFVNYEKIV